jgi:single-stranded DNA-binding protein
MISVTATGFIGEKPQLQVVSASSQKVEFDVIWGRRAFSAGQWKTAWERATFVAWGEEAERIAGSLDKGNNVSCTGLQETSEWTDRDGNKRSKVKFKLTAWIKHHNPRPQDAAPQSGRPAAVDNSHGHSKANERAGHREQSEVNYQHTRQQQPVPPVNQASRPQRGYEPDNSDERFGGLPEYSENHSNDFIRM